MGCDIHVFLERRVGDKWEGDTSNNLYSDRDYVLFALLAGVRNYYNITPIAPPKGIPTDASAYIKENFDDYDGHTPSYYTFAELVEYFKIIAPKKYTNHEGFVDEVGYKYFKQHGYPNQWCRNVGGGNIEKVLNYEMDRIIQHKYPWETCKQYYTAVNWKVSYTQVLDELMHSIDAYMKTHNIREAELNNYRIVFYFDN